MSSEPVALQTKDYKVADVSLADWGRKEIAIAERGAEMIAASKRAEQTQRVEVAMAEASEIADAVAYLASGEARYVNGATLAIDGGQTAG